MLITKVFIVTAAVFLFLSVSLGAFGAHALEGAFTLKKIDTWQKATDYLMIHGFAILASAVLIQNFPEALHHWRKAAISFILGSILFSGSLLVWVLTDIKSMVFLTPIGGLLFLLGWFMMILGGLSLRTNTQSNN